MEKDLERFKPCTPCTCSCLEAHGCLCKSRAEKSFGAPSFLKMITDKHLPSNAGFVRLPSTFMEEYRRRIGNVVTVEGPSGWVGQVVVSYNDGFGFCGGWNQFVVHHNIEAGDCIVCTLVADSKFYAKVYNRFGSEKVHLSHAPTAEGSKAVSQKLKDGAYVSDSLTLKTSDGGREFSLATLGGKRKTLDEMKLLSGIGKKLCMQQIGLDSLGAENGNVEVEVRSQVLPEKFKFPCDQNSDPQSPQYLDAAIATTPLHAGPRSKECSSSHSEKKNAEMEDDVDNCESATRKRAHQAVYETEMRRFMAMEAAQAYETSNPRTMLVVNKTAITKSQSYFSSVFARKWFPEERTQLLLIDEYDNKWAVTFIPTASHMVLGAGWAKFVHDNKLEKGDVVVFELKDLNALTLIVHIFRVKDYKFVRVENLGKTKHIDSSTVSTPPKTEKITSEAKMRHIAERRKGNQSLSSNDEPKSFSSIAPQYAAVAKYFASQGSSSVYRTQKTSNGVTQEVQGQKANEEYEKVESEVLRHRGELSSMTMQGLPSVMPIQGSPLSVSQSRESEGIIIDLKEKTRPCSKKQPAQPTVPPMMVSGRTTGSNCFTPTAPMPPQQLQFLLAQQGQVAYGMPPHLGGALLLAPPGQVPCAMPMQEGTNFANWQQIQPLQALRQDKGYHEVLVPPGLPKEVEFPRQNKEEKLARPRKKWEIKPRRPRPPTDAERQRAMNEAYEFWTPNPHVMVALKPSQVYAGFSLTLRCAALPDETRDAVLVDSTGQSWLCKWLVNHSGRRLSAGWKRFAVDHLLEEGDVCVFEMIDRVNLTLLIHIFRIELDDHVSKSIEVRKSKEQRTPADPSKRKRKSRAKQRELGPLLPKLPAYSGCRMEKLGGNILPLRGANILPNMPSYKYTALQSRRRPVTMEERRRAELGARNLNTKNPSVTVVMRNSSVYCHFLVSIPSAFAKQWLPRKLVRVTLMDSGGQKSIARWAGNRKKSACLKSFREFSLSHCLEEGDALVFELMDANPNNPAFLVHVFRVLELPSARMSPKDWENHYKLDVMIGTIKPVVPLQAYQRRYDGESCILQAYQPLSSNSEEEQGEDEPSQIPYQPSSLPQLSLNSKAKAIDLAQYEENEANGHLDSVQYNVGEGTSHNVETLALIGHEPAEVFADRSTHISQLERLGRQKISRDTMPLLKGTLRIEGLEIQSGNTTLTTQTQANDVCEKTDAEAQFHASHHQDGVREVGHDCKPLVSEAPKAEPVEEVRLPKKSKRIRRKTTLRREGRDEFLQVTLGELTNWQLQGSQYNRQEDHATSDVHKKSRMASEMASRQLDSWGFQDLVSLTHTSLELQSDANAPKLELFSSSMDRQENRQPPSCLNLPIEASIQERDHLAQNQHVLTSIDYSTLDKSGSDAGVHWLKPKPEPVNGGDGILVMSQEGNSHTENEDLEVPQPDQGEGTLVKHGAATQFRQVFFGSIMDTVNSKVGAHHCDAKTESRRYVE